MPHILLQPGYQMFGKLKVFASLPTRYTRKIFLRGLIRLPDFPFLWPGSHLKMCFMVTTSFRGRLPAMYAGDNSRPIPRWMDLET